MAASGHATQKEGSLMADEQIYDVMILGSGPAGGTAAIYTSRAGLKTALVTGPVPGGQLTGTSEIENFPGFPQGLKGPQFGELLEQQARRFGTEFIFDIITAVDLSVRPFVLRAEEAAYRCRALIVCTGSSPRRLGLAAEREFTGRGVSYCATCDGRFFEGKTVAVAGGGDSAAEDASYLARLAGKVYVIHRRGELRAHAAMQKKVQENPKIEFLWHSVIEDLKGDERGLRRIVVRDVRDGAVKEVPTDGLFVAIGHTPNAGLFKDSLELDAQGYIVTDRLTRTKVPGVFAAGDVADPHFRQAITAAGTGCAAGMEATRYLEAEGE